MKSIKILFKENTKWSLEKKENYNFYYSCSKKFYNYFLNQDYTNLNFEKFQQIYKKTETFDNFIFENNLFIFCLLDKLNSENIYYYKNEQEIIISNNIYEIIKFKNNNFKLDEDSIIDTKILGYTTQNKTIFKDIFSLQAGEYLFIDKKKCSLKINNYFKFYSTYTSNLSRNEALLKLKKIEDIIFEEIIQKNRDKKILLALSGGLDSRYVLSCLLKRNFNNILLFSYGHKNNFDSIVSKKVASSLNIEWKMFESNNSSYKKMYQSIIKEDYWNYAGQGVIPPNLYFFESIHKISKLFDKKKVTILNGQAGDFITGNHLPNFNKEYLTGYEVINYLYEKHFQLNKKFYSNNIFKKKYFDQISAKLEIDQNKYYHYQQASKYYEQWEWQERQSKRVINMQKIYDFFNLKWELPLWHNEYINFWIDQPYGIKFKRNLYIEYLVRNDTYKLFHYGEKTHPKWLSTNTHITIFGKLIKLLGTKYASEYYYNFMNLFCKYGYMYSPYSFATYLKKFNIYKDPLAFINDDWIEKNKKILK